MSLKNTLLKKGKNFFMHSRFKLCIKGNINNSYEMIWSVHRVDSLTFRYTQSIYSICKSSDIKKEKIISGTLGIFVGSSPYFILDVLFRVKSPKTTYTRIYGCYSGLLGGSRIRCREWFCR